MQFSKAYFFFHSFVRQTYLIIATWDHRKHGIHYDFLPPPPQQLLTFFTTTTTFVFEALVRLQTRFCIKSFNLYSGQAGDTSDCQQHSVLKLKRKNTRPNNVLLAVWSTKSSYTFYKDYWRHFDVWRRRLWCSAFLLHFYSILTLRLNKKNTYYYATTT